MGGAVVSDVSVNTVAAATGTKVMHAGTGMTIFGVIFSSEFVAALGIVLSIGGFLVSSHYRRRAARTVQQESTERLRRDAEDRAARNQRDIEYHAARMAALRGGRAVDEGAPE
ncbi:MAG TPA: holin [Solimonas sp.]|nr:holin [Solimonas sp.]